MEFLVITLLIVAFFLWPTYGVINKEITVKGVTIYKDNTPIHFYSTIVFLYFSGIAFSCIMWQVP